MVLPLGTSETTLWWPLHLWAALPLPSTNFFPCLVLLGATASKTQPHFRQSESGDYHSLFVFLLTWKSVACVAQMEEFPDFTFRGHFFQIEQLLPYNAYCVFGTVRRVRRAWWTSACVVLTIDCCPHPQRGQKGELSHSRPPVSGRVEIWIQVVCFRTLARSSWSVMKDLEMGLWDMTDFLL